ncbi:hypothetical protein CC80DRAFT_564291 [Byssothecium circinans]|uniref:Uncharacterized protein n=1 Tax=Byssothecium circinans TaxID=147558 RepID=A0A6A5TSB5_9PLEO|nr:hypothetical protein CC80DRAFT_564291 [Byssothecium circinans]
MEPTAPRKRPKYHHVQGSNTSSRLRSHNFETERSNTQQINTKTQGMIEDPTESFIRSAKKERQDRIKERKNMVATASNSVNRVLPETMQDQASSSDSGFSVPLAKALSTQVIKMLNTSYTAEPLPNSDRYIELMAESLKTLLDSHGDSRARLTKSHQDRHGENSAGLSNGDDGSSSSREDEVSDHRDEGHGGRLNGGIGQGGSKSHGSHLDDSTGYGGSNDHGGDLDDSAGLRDDNLLRHGGHLDDSTGLRDDNLLHHGGGHGRPPSETGLNGPAPLDYDPIEHVFYLPEGGTVSCNDLPRRTYEAISTAFSNAFAVDLKDHWAPGEERRHGRFVNYMSVKKRAQTIKKGRCLNSDTYFAGYPVSMPTEHACANCQRASRPCARLSGTANDAQLCFFPVEEELRGGLSFEDVDFWITEG